MANTGPYEFGFLSGLVGISFPSGGLITLELQSGIPENNGTDQDIVITEWSVPDPLPNYDVFPPDQFFSGTDALATYGNTKDGVQPSYGTPDPTGLDYGGIGDTGGRGGYFGSGLLNELAGRQEFPSDLLTTALTWPQPYGMMPISGDYTSGPQVGAIFFSLKSLKGNPLNITLNWSTGGPTPLSGTVIVKYYADTPTGFTLSADFPLLTPDDGADGNATEPDGEQTIDLPYTGDPSDPDALNITITLLDGQLTVSSSPA